MWNRILVFGGKGNIGRYFQDGFEPIENSHIQIQQEGLAFSEQFPNPIPVKFKERRAAVAGFDGSQMALLPVF